MNKNTFENDQKNKLINFPQRKNSNYIQRIEEYNDEYDEDDQNDYDNDFDEAENDAENYDENIYDEEFDDEEYDDEEVEEDSEDSENLFEEKDEETNESGVEKNSKKRSFVKKKKSKKTKTGKKKALDKFGKKLLPGKSLSKTPIKATIRKKMTAFLMSPKGVIVIIIVFLVLLLALIILMETGIIGDAKGNSTSTGAQGITASKCEYNVNGINQDTMVELINCDATKDNYTVFETMTLEKYIAGVAIAEIGEEAIENEEAMKAQLIAVRSYTLTRNVDVYGVGFDEEDNVIRMRACENDQVYWDYSTDIYRGSGNIAYYSPYEYTPAEGEKPWKSALTEEQKQKYEAIVQSVIGEYAIDSSNNVYHTPYSSNDEKTAPTDRFLSLAKDNDGTENGKYTSILMNVYPEVTGTNIATCNLTYYNDAGEYSTWKQKAKLGAPWADVVIGYDSAEKRNVTIDDVGCTITSIAMQIKHSGIPTGDITDFNPGTFATALKNAGNLKPGGGIKSFWDIQNVVPGFKYAETIYPEGNNDIKDAAEKGYYIVMEVRQHNGGQHWVALDVKNSANANWEEIYIWDPAMTITKLSDEPKYNANRLICFKVEES